MAEGLILLISRGTVQKKKDLTYGIYTHYN